MNSLKINIIHLLKWLLICILAGTIIGSAVALFLLSLDAITVWREKHFWIIYSLPIVGFFIGAAYYYWGDESKKGNNLLIQEHKAPNNKIPFKMAPLVLVGTLLTHLAGGSAGREGTALQMGGAISDQFTNWFKLKEAQRKTIIIIGISAGFAAVFGTPFAGAIFALEIMLFKNIQKTDIIPSFLAAFIAHYTCIAWGVHHTQYNIPNSISINMASIIYCFLAGLIFGITALLFSKFNLFWSSLFKKIKYEPLKPVIGGVILIIAITLLGTTKHIGLGIPTIIESFNSPGGKYDFMIKLLLTTFTLSAGFKGGEVTPLFFIGATLGNILICFIPLPMALLAGMGFVAVFAGATHAAITGIVLGIEMFGLQAGVFVGLASVVAYFSSGEEGIYSAQIKEGAKYTLYNYLKRVSKL